MIKSLEVWNYESHLHSRLEFGPTMNLLWGTSDSGKSSLLRAICLPAYNRWSEDMLRVGTKSAKVIVTTERGSVEVERGPGVHRWLVTWMEEGKVKTEAYSKLGRGNVPERATWVMGMPKVQVAGTESTPNAMFQMDKPFLLSEFEGKSCSSSVVAQVIDELSGLIGLDDLQREINLDLLRSKRTATELEDIRKGLEERKGNLQDAAPLRAISSLGKAQLKEIDGLVTWIEKARGYAALLADLQTKLSSIILPAFIDFDACSETLENAVSCLQRRERFHQSSVKISDLVLGVDEVEKKLVSIPDCVALLDRLVGAVKDSARLQMAQTLKDKMDSTLEERKKTEGILQKIPDCNAMEGELGLCTQNEETRKAATTYRTNIVSLQQELRQAGILYTVCAGDLNEAQRLLKEQLQGTCPVCGQELAESETLKALVG